MVSHRVFCTETASVGDDHDVHVEAVGVGREPDQPERRLTRQEVYDRLAEGETFYTRGPESEKVAVVAEHRCAVCGEPTLQTHGAVTTDNAIETLPACNWR